MREPRFPRAATAQFSVQGTAPGGRGRASTSPPRLGYAETTASCSRRFRERCEAAARLVACVTLPRQLKSAGVGRRFVVTNLRRWLGDLDCVYDAEMIVSEIMGNAVRHGRDDFVSLCVTLVDEVVGIELGERSPELARALAPADEDAEDGRGLLIVEAAAVALITPSIAVVQVPALPVG